MPSTRITSSPARVRSSAPRRRPAAPPDPVWRESLSHILLHAAQREFIVLMAHKLAWVAPPAAQPEVGWLAWRGGEDGWLSEDPAYIAGLAQGVCDGLADSPAPPAVRDALLAALRREDVVPDAFGPHTYAVVLRCAYFLDPGAAAAVHEKVPGLLLAHARRDARLRGWDDGLPPDPDRPGWHKLRARDGTFRVAAWSPPRRHWEVYLLDAGRLSAPVSSQEVWRRHGYTYTGPACRPVFQGHGRPLS